MSVQERFQGPGWEWDQELVKAVDAFEALYPGVVYWGSCGGFSCGPLTHVAYCDVKSVGAPGNYLLFSYDYRGLRVGDISGDEAIALLENELGVDETQARILMFYMSKGLAGWYWYRFK